MKYFHWCVSLFFGRGRLCCGEWNWRNYTRVVRRTPRKRIPQSGFTLIEVMIALAILAGMLTLLLRGAAGNVASTKRSQLMTAATELARAKMYDIEEGLLAEGFQLIDQEDEGDFEEEGWPKISWKSEITKIELPNAEALGGFGESEGETDTTASGGVGAAMVGSQFEMIKNMMEASVRRVRVTVAYQVTKEIEEFSVDCYFTDPAAISNVANLGAAGAAGSASETSGGSDSGATGNAGSQTKKTSSSVRENR